MGAINSPSSLHDLLADQLPKDVAFTLHHYSTPPTKSTPLFSAPPHHKSERTYCESHFLAVSVTPKRTAVSSISQDVLILGIEVLIYTTNRLTTIFISKADSTGYLSLLDIPKSQAGSPLKAICGTFVTWLARERRRDGKKLVVSLFARAQDQYLFPGSIENENKHVLDDRGLVKWWCRVLDPMVEQYKTYDDRTLSDRLANAIPSVPPTSSPPLQEGSAKGYLIVPGVERNDILRYTPSPSAPGPRRWAAAHPLLDIAPYPTAPPRCLIPHFPDDPKSRFLDELDDELPDRGTDAMLLDGGTPSRSNGQWKSVKTLDQFWEFMAYRQECSAGRLVGFIWVVINPPDLGAIQEEEDEPSQALSSFAQDGSQERTSTAPNTPKKKSHSRNARRKRINMVYGPIPLRLPKIKSSSSSLSNIVTESSANIANLVPDRSPYYTWPVTSRGDVIISAKEYERAHQILLQQNFGNYAAAVRSTKRWKDEISVLGGVDAWNRKVVGKKEDDIGKEQQANGTAPVTVIGVRKKRKIEAAVANDSVSDISKNGSVQLGVDLVRKKPKQETASAPEVKIAGAINTLSAGLVRKKPRS